MTRPFNSVELCTWGENERDAYPVSNQTLPASVEFEAVHTKYATYTPLACSSYLPTEPFPFYIPENVRLATTWDVYTYRYTLGGVDTRAHELRTPIQDPFE